MNAFKFSLYFLMLLAVISSCGDATGPSSAGPTPSVLTAVLEGDSVILSWTVCLDGDFASYIPFRSFSSGISGNPSAATALTVINDPNTVLYIDHPTPIDTTLHYCIRTTDDDNNTSWSNEVSFGVPSSVPDVTGFELDESSV